MGSLKFLLFVVLLTISNHLVSGRKFFAGHRTSFEGPPPPTEDALMARYVVHNSDWVSVGTISVAPEITGYPFVGLKSMADGPMINGSGVPYMMMTDMDISMNDLNHDNRCTLFITLAQGSYCQSNNYDPQDPRCARVMLTGRVVKVEKDTEEDKFAKAALLARHPPMADWPIDHGFYVAKMEIEQIGVLAFFGGIKHVTPEEYFHVQPKQIVPHGGYDRYYNNEIEVKQIIF